MTTDLKKGSFYWVMTVSDDQRQAMIPEVEWQPARFTGRTLDGGGQDTWDFIGRESANGHHFVDVMKIGEELRRTVPLETDYDFRLRVVGYVSSREELDRVAVMSGMELDAEAFKYGLWRGVTGPDD